MAERDIFDVGGNRAFATGVDLIALLMVFGWLARVAPGLEYAMPVLAFAYLAVLPATRLQGTLGMLLGWVKLTDRQGGRLTWKASAIRAGAKVAWFCLPVVMVWLGERYASLDMLREGWFLIFFLPWASIGLRQRRESAFDLLSGSVVSIRGAAPEAISDAPELRVGQKISGLVAGILCLGLGVVLFSATHAQRIHERRIRTSYAMEQVEGLRAKVEAFYVQNRRWPSVQEIHEPDWNPYPDGGGYRLLDSGVIEITFTVLADLKGHRITFVPSLVNGGPVWTCSTDAEFDKRYLPIKCN